MPSDAIAGIGLPPRTAWDVFGWGLAFVSACVFALSFGLNYGVDNQTTYLLDALRVVSPGTLDADWYAAHTTHYHPVFTYLAALLLKANAHGWGIAIAEVVVTVIGMLFTYWAVLELCGRRLAPGAFLLLVCFTYLTRTAGPGASYVFRGLFQPSALGSLGLLSALPFFLRGRYLASGVCLALGGIFHANFLLLSFPLFGLAQLLLGTRGLIRRTSQQLGPACVSLLLLAPVIFAAVGSTDGGAARDLFLHMRLPHHFVPASFERAFSPFVGFQLLGLAAGFWSLNDGRPGTSRMGALLASLLVLLWGGTALTTATYVPAVAQLFVWRVAPFADLWCQLLVCHAVVLAISDPAGIRQRFSNPTLALGVAGFGFLIMFYGDRHDSVMVGFLAALFCVLIVAWTLHALSTLRDREPLVSPDDAQSPLWGAGIAVALGVLLFATVARDVPKLSRTSSSILRGFPQPEMDLYAWMKAKTSKRAQFLTPPDMEAARYHGQRPIVVDWKSSPIRPVEFLQWRDRMADVVGKTSAQFAGYRDLSGYHLMDQARLERLKRKYKLNYAVIRRGRERGLKGKVAFQNRGFVVLEL